MRNVCLLEFLDVCSRVFVCTVLFSAMAEWLFLMFFVFHSNMQIKLKAFQGDAHEDL